MYESEHTAMGEGREIKCFVHSLYEGQRNLWESIYL